MVLLGLAAKAAMKIGGKAVKGVAGKLGKSFGRGKKRRSRGLNLNKYAKKLIKARLDGKIMKEKFKVINIIK